MMAGYHILDACLSMSYCYSVNVLQPSVLDPEEVAAHGLHALPLFVAEIASTALAFKNNSDMVINFSNVMYAQSAFK